MEASPYVPGNITEDSGLGESRNESNPSTLFTPTSSSIFSRKRKILPEFQKTRSSLTKQSSVESVESSPWTTNANILSSTMNDSITTGVEKCKIDSFQANYYIERSDNDNTSFLKNIKEPTTPAKSGTKRFCNNNASPRLSPLLKLGSPERNGLLYPILQPNSSRFSDTKRCSPAKKCLFTSGLRKFRKDPVSFFSRERNVYGIVKKIFLQLGDEDLYASFKVCKNWQGTIKADINLSQRLKSFIRNKIMNKENFCESPYFTLNSNSHFSQGKQSTPIEPLPTMNELTNSLTEGQHLEKCIGCNKSEAVVEKNISQCTNLRCGMIRCLKCNSISKTGPQNFHDNCQQSILLIERPTPRYSLLNSPPKHYENDNSLSTFFMDDLLNTSNSRHSSHSRNSSGYMTDSEISQNQRLSSSSYHKKKGNISHILKVCNTKNKTPEKNWERRNSVLPVITSNRKIVEIIEPSSPPKVNYVACTKKSKRMLKRLKL